MEGGSGQAPQAATEQMLPMKTVNPLAPSRARPPSTGRLGLQGSAPWERVGAKRRSGRHLGFGASPQSTALSLPSGTSVRLPDLGAGRKLNRADPDSQSTTTTHRAQHGSTMPFSPDPTSSRGTCLLACRGTASAA